MKKVVATALMAAGLALAAPAVAAPVITLTSPTPSGAITGTFSDTGIGAGSFTDVLNFALPTGLASATISSIFLTNQANNIDFSSVTLNGTPFTVQSTGQIEFRTLSGLPVTSGNQTLSISGTSGGDGSYAGTISFTPLAAAVPEPATYATMTAGLGLIGFALRRRKKAAGGLAYAA